MDKNLIEKNLSEMKKFITCKKYVIDNQLYESVLRNPKIKEGKYIKISIYDLRGLYIDPQQFKNGFYFEKNACLFLDEATEREKLDRELERCGYTLIVMDGLFNTPLCKYRHDDIAPLDSLKFIEGKIEPIIGASKND